MINTILLLFMIQFFCMASSFKSRYMNIHVTRSHPYESNTQKYDNCNVVGTIHWTHRDLAWLAIEE